jgi:hypothetical protein
MLPKPFLAVALLALACGAPQEIEDSDMAKTNIPKALGYASAAQLRADAKSNFGGRYNTPDPTANNFGSSIDIVVPAGGISAGGATPEIRLVTGSAFGLHGNVPADIWDGLSWVFTGGQIKLNPNFTNSPSGFYYRIRYGTGGYMQELILSAMPFVSIALPANTVDVSVFGKGHAGGVTIQGGTYTFAGNLHRGNLSKGSNTASLLTFPDDHSPFPVIGTTNIDVPAFARRVKTLGPTTDAQVYGAGIRLIFNGFGNLTYTGPELLVLKNLGVSIDIPPGTNQLVWLGRATADVPFLQWDVEL